MSLCRSEILKNQRRPMVELLGFAKTSDGSEQPSLSSPPAFAHFHNPNTRLAAGSMVGLRFERPPAIFQLQLLRGIFRSVPVARWTRITTRPTDEATRRTWRLPW